MSRNVCDAVEGITKFLAFLYIVLKDSTTALTGLPHTDSGGRIDCCD